jgi:hypothetical protein
MAFNRHGVEIGVFLAIADLLIYQHFTPAVTDVKVSEPFDLALDKSQREALVTCVVVNAVVAGASRSLDPFIIGGVAVICIDFALKHANAVHPSTQTMQPPGGYNQAMPSNGSGGGSDTDVYNLPDYASAAS